MSYKSLSAHCGEVSGFPSQSRAVDPGAFSLPEARKRSHWGCEAWVEAAQRESPAKMSGARAAGSLKHFFHLGHLPCALSSEVTGA